MLFTFLSPLLKSNPGWLEHKTKNIKKDGNKEASIKWFGTINNSYSKIQEINTSKKNICNSIIK